MSCGNARREVLDPGDLDVATVALAAHGTGEPAGRRRTPDEPEVGVGGHPERHVPGPGAGQMPGYHRVVGVAHRHLVRRLVAPDARLGRLVRRQVGVAVQVVGGEVEPRAHRGGEAPRVLETKRRRLDHEHIGGRIGDGGHQRHRGVAHGDCSQPGGHQHVAHQRRHRGLAVRAGDGEQRPVVPPRGEVELRQDRHAGSPRPARTRDGAPATQGRVGRPRRPPPGPPARRRPATRPGRAPDRPRPPGPRAPGHRRRPARRGRARAAPGRPPHR